MAAAALTRMCGAWEPGRQLFRIRPRRASIRRDGGSLLASHYTICLLALVNPTLIRGGDALDDQTDMQRSSNRGHMVQRFDLTLGSAIASFSYLHTKSINALPTSLG